MKNPEMEGNPDQGQVLLVSIYAALVMTVLSCGAVAMYNLTRDRTRNNLWFYSERTKRHAIAGCLLVLGFFLPLMSRRLIDPYLAIICSLVYAFVVVPVASGLIDASPVFIFFKQLLEWLVQVLVTGISLFSFAIAVMFKLIPIFYRRSPEMQSTVRQIVFFYLCRTWLSEFPYHQLLPLQTFGIYRLILSMFCVFEGNHEEDPNDIFTSRSESRRSFIILPIIAMSVIICSSDLQPAYFTITSTYFVLNQLIRSTSTPMHPLTNFIKGCHFWFFFELEHILLPIIFEVCSIAFALPIIVTSKPISSVGIALFILVIHPVLQSTLYSKLRRELFLLEVYPQQVWLSSGGKDSEDFCCPICLDDMVLSRKTHCGHHFHWLCLRTCILSDRRCPICRAEVLL